MKNLSLIVLLVFFTHFNLFSQNRPKVLVDQAQIEEIKLKINITGTYSYEIWQILKSKIPVSVSTHLLK